MNYDMLAKMSAEGLRSHCRGILAEYNSVTGEKIAPFDIRRMPKARLLYMACRFEAESDVRRRTVDEREERRDKLCQIKDVTQTLQLLMEGLSTRETTVQCDLNIQLRERYPSQKTPPTS